MKKYLFIKGKRKPIVIWAYSMVDAINKFKRNRVVGEEYTEVQEYINGIHVGGIKKEAGKWLAYAIDYTR
jgi:hypothetical protein